MKYSIRDIAEIAGVSARTLRYYDEIDLLKPSFVNAAGYRYYDDEQLMLLQQILFYRERGLGLNSIKQIVYQKDFDVLNALEDHLCELQKKQDHIERMIAVVKKTITSMKGECIMSDEEKFSVFKEKMISENELRYAQEIREKYGESTIDESNKKILNMTPAEWKEFQLLEEKIKIKLVSCVKNQDSVESNPAKHVVDMHKQWLMKTWKIYSTQAHKGLALMYTADERFKSYYDKEIKGCADYLMQAIMYWADKLEKS